MKYLVYALQIISLFFTFVLMVLGMVSDSTTWYLQLIIAFIGAPSWIYLVSTIGKFNDTFIKD